MEAKVLTKSFKSGSEDLLVLDKLRLKIMRGRGAAITGASGSGKSTLLYILGGLDQPSSGTVLSEGKDIFTLGDAALAAWRAKSVGFVFQFHHLLPEFTALENVAMPLMLHGSSRGEALERAEPILTRVGLSERLKHRPGLLSGGERQRVAIARALVMEPKILLADEPTGNLDNKNANLINELIMELTKEKGMSAVVATHNSKLASLLDVLYKLENGVLKELSREKWE
jgi:lipoprotein-releasing system ATP-binding protein